MSHEFKLALIGGGELTRYTIADKLWSIINKYSPKKFQFSLVTLNTADDLSNFVSQFRSDNNFLGFNVALPWKNEITKYTDKKHQTTRTLSLINTVSKVGNEIHSFNTDVLGITMSLDKSFFKSGKKVLVLGAGGAGFSCGEYIAKLNKNNHIFYYSLNPTYKSNTRNSRYILSYNELKVFKFDLIINATPLGRLSLNEIPNGFHSPLDLAMLKRITHSRTIVQEMNYIPINTLLLQLSKEIKLRTIPGYYMLVYQALESYKKYFYKDHIELPVRLIMDEVRLVAKYEDRKIMTQRLSSH